MQTLSPSNIFPLSIHPRSHSSASSELINIAAHRIKLRLPRRHQVPYLRDISNMLVARKLLLRVCDRLFSFSFRYSEQVSQDVPVQCKDSPALDKCFERWGRRFIRGQSGRSERFDRSEKTRREAH